MAYKPIDAHAAALEELGEIQCAIQGIAEIQQEIDVSRVCDDGLPEWWNDRHNAGLIGAIKFLSAHTLDVVERMQLRHESSEGER